MPNFAKIKADNRIEDVAVVLGLDLKKSGEDLRCECPVCETDNKRSITISPTNQAFRCWPSEEYGSLLDLVMHVQGVSLMEAGKFIEKDTRPPEKQEERTPPVSKETIEGEVVYSGIKPQHLAYEHERIQELDLEPDVAEALGIAWCKRGMMVSRIVIPIRLEDGTLSGYVGIKDANIKLPPRWHGL